jgi:hypothetical protein
MTWSDGMIRPDALRVRDGKLVLAVHIPWYRSLPLSCLEALQTVVDGHEAGSDHAPLRIGQFCGSLPAAVLSDAWWDLRDPLEIPLDVPGSAGQTYTVDVSVACRIPYIQQAPGVPLVQRTSASARLVAT